MRRLWTLQVHQISEQRQIGLINLTSFIVLLVTIDEELEGCVEGFAVGTLSAGSTGRQGNTVDEVLHRLDVHWDRQRESLCVAVTRSLRFSIKCHDTNLRWTIILRLNILILWVIWDARKVDFSTMLALCGLFSHNFSVSLIEFIRQCVNGRRSIHCM